jgi:hypothetical protein
MQSRHKLDSNTRTNTEVMMTKLYLHFRTEIKQMVYWSWRFNSFNAKTSYITQTRCFLFHSIIIFSIYLYRGQETWAFIFRNYRTARKLLNNGMYELLRIHKAQKSYSVIAFINGTVGNTSDLNASWDQKKVLLSWRNGERFTGI